ncbi:PspA/IM30 family protein [Paenibacillus donghaensis]|uniref:Phage shock protein A n=1 Tax=Paenibacillus donghaensis TaxID=414771 RepID=A0A2Z2KAA1_9BACL|nr:PspA/IM30 family protein [Paenibacillus donghaensis]ASA19713.1 hypothetical protein B9T62_02125 [Paenibacillus donghaensis]
MSIMTRIATLTKAALHEGLNKLENPVLLTGQYLRDLEQEIDSAEKKHRELKVAATVLERRLSEYRLQADRSESEALQAMQQGNEAAARVAVSAKLRYLESADECTTGLEETRQMLIGLEASLAGAKEEFVRLKAKRTELAARARKAAEKEQANRAAAGSAPGFGRSHSPLNLNAGNASRGFERMEDKINEWEVLADSSASAFSASRPGAPAVNPEISSAVDAELERLRGQQGSGK